MILVDAHVHIYDCFDLEKFFDVAFENFKAAFTEAGHGNDFTGIILLAESFGCDWFDRLKILAEAEQSPQKNRIGSWAFDRTSEESSIIAYAEDNKTLILVAGRQIVTAEKLELLALATDSSISDGEPIKKLIGEVSQLGGIPVIPWGFGKWIGRRGTILKELLESIKDPGIFLGDNGGRPKFLGQPFFFKMADNLNIKVLPGSDPLPFTSEYNRTGSFGCCLSGDISYENPVNDLKKMLFSPDIVIQKYGRLERPYRFIRNQVLMKLKNGF